MLRLRVSLDYDGPPIWRELNVSNTMTLHELHRAIQLLFGWQDYHLYEFRVANERFEAPDEEASGLDSTKTRLGRLRLRPGQGFRYKYDFGDNWSVSIQILGEYPVDGDRLPWLIDGERSGPPEDCGGPHRFVELLALLEKPLDDLEEEEREEIDGLRRDYNPAAFCVDQARNALILTNAWGSLRRKR